MSDVIEFLESKGRNVAFFQAMSLLEEYFGERGNGVDPVVSGAVRFSANAEITFPSSDIASLKKRSGAGVEFFLSFMGLLGISSPLPHYFTEYGARHSLEPCALTDFLNIFDHRIYTLFYQAWKKYRPVPTYSQVDSFSLYKRMAQLAGWIGKEQSDSNNRCDLAYAGLFAGHSHSADALAEILADKFPGVEVKIEQWAPRWAKINTIRKLGENLVLGNNAMLSNRIYDRSGKIVVEISLSDSNSFEAFLPGSDNMNKIMAMVKLFSPEPLAFDVAVCFTPSALVPAVLGDMSARIGITAACGNVGDTGQSYSVTVAGPG